MTSAPKKPTIDNNDASSSMFTPLDGLDGNDGSLQSEWRVNEAAPGALYPDKIVIEDLPSIVNEQMLLEALEIDCSETTSKTILGLDATTVVDK